MAGATLFLAFLPMLPAQILLNNLLNNLLYDISELPICYLVAVEYVKRLFYRRFPVR